MEAGKKHGLKPFGMYALDSACGLKKATAPGRVTCLPTIHHACRVGLERFVKLDKPQDFPGKAAIQNEKATRCLPSSFVTLLVNAGECDAPYMSTLWHNGK